MKSTSSQGPSTHLDAPEDAVCVYSVLGTTEDGCGVVIALIPRAVATNTKKGEQGSGWSTGAIWKRASAAEGMPFKSSQGKSRFWPHSTGATLEAGICDGWGCSILTSPPRSLPSSSDSHTHTAPSGSMPLSDKPGKVTVAGFHPQQVVHHLDGRADSCEYLRNEQMPQIHIKYSAFFTVGFFLSAPHDSVLTR